MEKISTGGVFILLRFVLAGVCAGVVNGLLGAGGGMVLVPLLTLLTSLEEKEIVPASIAIIAPICAVSLGVTAITTQIPWKEALPYLFGSAAGGFLAGKFGKKIPVKWLHRGLGILILWGGIRNLC